MKARDWLIQQGLAKKGRGRLSREAKAALDKAISEGMSFSDYAKTSGSTTPVRIKKVVAAITTEQIKKRIEKVIYGIDRAKKPGQEDLVIAFDQCAACGKPIEYCFHDTPQLPPWLDSKVYLTKP